jgi:hypothetical protein
VAHTAAHRLRTPPGTRRNRCPRGHGAWSHLRRALHFYRIQFPVLRQYERNTYYDRHGRTVYLDGDTAYGLSTPEWRKQRDKDRIIVEKTDDTLPTGHHAQTIVYDAPFDKCDREED